MASLDEELLHDMEEDQREMAYIREQLPADLKEKFNDTDLLYMMEKIVDYYFTSGILDSQADKDGFIDIDMEEVAKYVCDEAAKEKQGDYDPEEVLLVAQADMDFQEANC